MVSSEKSVSVQNWEELLPTGEYHGGLKKGSGIWDGPNGMDMIYTFGKMLKVKRQNLLHTRTHTHTHVCMYILKKEQQYEKLSCGIWITFYCYIAESYFFMS